MPSGSPTREPRVCAPTNEAGAGIAADAANFPTTAGAFHRTGAAQNNLDAFVTKLNPTGTAAIYSTFIGGNSFDWGRAIAVDSTGAAYVAGQTQSNGTFPVTSGAFDRTFNVENCPRCGIDQQDGFVLKLNPAGSSLVYSTYLGGTQFDDILGIALDSARNAYVTGQTGNSGFPTTAGAFDRTNAGSLDAFVTKLNATGSALLYSTTTTSAYAATGLPTRRMWWRVRANDGGAWSRARRFELK